MHISICNLNPGKNEKVICSINGFDTKTISGTIITSGELNAHNTFDKPTEVGIKEFKAYNLKGGTVEVDLPPASVITLELTGDFKAKTANKVDRKDLKQGIICNRYEGTWTRLPDFTGLTATGSGMEKNFVYPQGLPSNNFGLNFTGYFEAKTDGLYDFFITSDDGAKLTIDDEDVIIHDGLHGMTERQGTVFLSKGIHSIALPFFQAGGGSGLKVQYKSPSGEKQDIPAELLWFK
jgi:hypothetical protein